MSHIVTIATEVHDPDAVAAACRRLGLPGPVHGTAALFEGQVAVRARGPESDATTELVVSRSGYGGSPVRFQTNRDFPKAEEATLARRKKQAQRAMIATLRSTPVDEVTDNFSVRHGSELALPREVAEAIVRRQAAQQEQMLADDPIGREIARLEAEKYHLLDTVWLACSPAQIKQLWTKVGELLGDEPTTLERDAPAIEPARED